MGNTGQPDALTVQRLQLHQFRNIEQLCIEPAPRFNVISGDNGQGKTSLLEALYCVATTRSFRTERLRELRREGSEFTRIDLALSEGPLNRTQRVVLSNAGRSVSADGEKPARLGEYALRTPVVVFHPGDLTLTMGAAAARRQLLDRVSLFLEPGLGEDRRRYRLAVRERQKVLDLRGTSAPDLEPYETLIARHGCRITQGRARAIEQLLEELIPSFQRLVTSRLALSAGYLPGGSADVSEALAELKKRRTNDRRRKMCTFGPHRDDLELTLEGRSARHHASQGQHRILSLSLKLAELTVIQSARGVRPLLLLDDVSSELDPTRIGAVYSFLKQSQNQVFVTTTRADLFATPDIEQSDRRDFRLHAGRLLELGSSTAKGLENKTS